MKTVVLGPRPAELDELIQRRHKLGIDTFDEVWKGSYHMAPAAHPAHGYVDNELAVVLAPLARNAGLVGTGPFNLGDPDDYRVPDRGYHRGLPTTTWVSTAAMVVEVVSPDDETYDKFGFYADHGVDELIVADPAARTVTCWARDGATYGEVSESALLGSRPSGCSTASTGPDRRANHPIFHPTNSGQLGGTGRNRHDDRSERT